MIRRIIEFSLDNKFIIILMMAAIFAGGIYAAKEIRLDAIPDLSDVQVIIRTDYAGQSPRIVEDQVTYPITTKMLSVPHAKVVRGYSFYNTSYVYIIFEDGTDMYWARSRVLEYMSQLQSSLPRGVAPQLGPDATGVGWAYMYTLTSKTRDLAQLRSLQDWFLKYELTSLPGVSEVASVGGFVLQYQITVDPEKMRAYSIPITMVREAVQRSNNEVGGRSIEMGETEYMIRGMGYVGDLTAEDRAAAAENGITLDIVRRERAVEDLESIVLDTSEDGTPILLRDIGHVTAAGEMRRGIMDWNGEGEAVGGIVVVRSGADTLDTIALVKGRIEELRKALPEDVEIHTGYDRTLLIEEAIGTLRHTLIEESLIVSLIIALFLLHFRSALVPILTLPLAVLMSFVIMHLQGLGANIMSLGGIAIAIGAMVDSSIITVENIHKHYEEPRGRTHWQIVRDSCLEVGPTLFYALLLITVSFLPIFALEAQEGRMFKPLAFTKTYAMGASAFLAITVSPVLAGYFIKQSVLPANWSRVRQRIAFAVSPVIVLVLVILALRRTDFGLEDFWFGIPMFLWAGVLAAVAAFLVLIPQRLLREDENPFNRFFVRAYQPLLNATLRSPGRARTIVWIAGILMVSAIIPYSQLGREFMPPLYEGDLLYMPTTLPGISPTKAREVLQQTDKIIATFPEVKTTWGKMGSAETATDPAPLMMIETTIQLKPVDEWPAVDITNSAGEVIAHRPRTPDELIEALDREIKFPGLTNAWTMPIKTRIDMLSTGIRTPVGIKISGPDLLTLERIGEKVEGIVRGVPGTMSVYAERVMGGRYINFRPDRLALQRHGLTIADVKKVFMKAIDGESISTAIEGLERYPINLRYPRELREDVDELGAVLVPTPQGYQIPLRDVGTFSFADDAPMIKSEQSRPNAWVYIDIEDVDVGTYVDRAKFAVDEAVRGGLIELPLGYSIGWSGQYEYMQRARERLMLVVPITFVIILVIVYLSTRDTTQTAIIILTMPFNLLGAFWMLYLMDYNLSVAVWVGIIALAGLDAETSQVMLLYLDIAWEKWKKAGRLISLEALRQAVIEGAAYRLRPKAMTVGSTMIGLLPILWATGAGADTMRRIAVPMIGGMVTSFFVELVVYPAIYFLWRSHQLRKAQEVEP